jgi:succinate dehydrogenase / fumarate reductase, cytochrome b subunit
MERLKRFFSSSIGLKMVVALTGAPLLFFVIGHMLGNLQIFMGQDQINNYAKGLHDIPALLWGARFGLLGLFIVHIGSATRLNMKNASARSVQYHHEATVQASLASRYMLLTGGVVLGFVVLHLLHFTVRAFNPLEFAGVDYAGRHDVYSMVVKGFSGLQGVLWVALYVACNVLLGFHISHGASSLFQSLGVNHPTYTPLLKMAGPGLAIAIVIGNLTIPLACLFGILSLPGGGS